MYGLLWISVHYKSTAAYKHAWLASSKIHSYNEYVVCGTVVSYKYLLSSFLVTSLSNDNYDS